MLKYKIFASFAIGYIDEDTISISARSKGGIDVSTVMKYFGGGGNEYSAAARVKGMSIEDIAKIVGTSREEVEFALELEDVLTSKR